MVAAIIPAAGKGTRMLPMTENTPKCMLPIGGKPIIYYQIKQLIDNNITDVWIVVNYKKDVIIDYVNFVFKDKINLHFVEQIELNGLLGAIKTSIEDIRSYNCFDSSFIYLSDILVEDNSIFDFTHDYISYEKVEDFSRWCLLDLDDTDKIISFNDKPNVEPIEKNAIIGAYYFSNLDYLYECILNVFDNNIKIKNEFQLSSALAIYINKVDVYGKNVEHWFDFGELDSYIRSSKKFNSSRFFNSIKFEDDCITKTSTNYHKLQNEICWFLTVPNKYNPNLIDYSMDDSNTFYKLDYINGVSLSDMWVNFNISEEKWLMIFRKLSEIFKYFYENSNKDFGKVDLFQFICKNLDSRLNDIDNEVVKNILNNDIILNNKPLVCFNHIKDILLDKLNNIRYCDKRIIHGDMVFSNIIYSEGLDKLYLIDPRGNFNGDIIYGDYRYDLAKIYQCIYGNYDLIKGNLFKLNHNTDEFELDFYLSDNTNVDKLMKILDPNIDINDIKLITAFQFITMISLHRDEPKHQIAMALIATKLFNEILNTSYKETYTDVFRHI